MTRLDGLIFDVDGVLIDANANYFKVVQKALGFFMRYQGITVVEETLLSWDHYRAAKGHPSFNDDYHIAWLRLRAGFSKKSSRDYSLSLEEWQKLLHRCPIESTIPWIEENFPQGPALEEVGDFCSELYFGEEYSRVTGKKATQKTGKGLWKNDTPLVRWHWKELPLPVSIYTGRPWEELILAFEILQWQDFPKSRCITSDLGITKPSPKGLEILAEKIESKHPGFFGDTASDALAFNSYGKGEFFPIGPFLASRENSYDSLNQALEEIGVWSL